MGGYEVMRAREVDAVSQKLQQVLLEQQKSHHFLVARAGCIVA